MQSEKITSSNNGHLQNKTSFKYLSYKSSNYSVTSNLTVSSDVQTDDIMRDFLSLSYINIF